MSAVPPPTPESLPGPEIDPSPAPDEAPASPSPEIPWPPQPAESPAPPPAETPAPAPVEMPDSPPVHAPTPAPPTPTIGRVRWPVPTPTIARVRWPAAAVLAGLLGLAGGPVAHAQLPTPAPTPAARTGAAAPVNAADRRFLDEATATGMVEIVLGRLAQEKAAGEPTRRFGQQMVDDHIKANEAMKAMAAAKGVQLPTGLTAEEKTFNGRMKKLKGPAFDKQYLGKMVADHQKAVALCAQASTSAADPDVKAFAQTQLPVLRSHLQMAREASAVPVARPKRGTAARE